MKNAIIRFLGGVPKQTLISISEDYDRSLSRVRTDLVDAHVALGRIIECETPGANATVRKMAKIAKGVLPLGISDLALTNLKVSNLKVSK